MAVETFGVDLEQHLHRMPGPLGDLGSWYAAVEPRRHARVTKVVRCARQRRGVDLIRQSRPASGPSGTHEMRELGHVLTREEPAIGSRTEPCWVIVQHSWSTLEGKALRGPRPVHGSSTDAHPDACRCSSTPRPHTVWLHQFAARPSPPRGAPSPQCKSQVVPTCELNHVIGGKRAPWLSNAPPAMFGVQLFQIVYSDPPGDKLCGPT